MSSDGPPATPASTTSAKPSAAPNAPMLAVGFLPMRLSSGNPPTSVISTPTPHMDVSREVCETLMPSTSAP